MKTFSQIYFVITLLISICLFAQEQNEHDLKFTYMGNEGVLLYLNDTKIIIDGLHRPYKRFYEHLPDSLRLKAENAQPPFDNIDLAFVTPWYLLKERGREILEKYIQPKQVVAIHISHQNKTETEQKIQENFPQAIACTELMKTYRINFDSDKATGP